MVSILAFNCQSSTIQQNFLDGDNQCSLSVPSSTEAASPIWLLGVLSGASAAEELDFTLRITLINLDLNSHMLLLAVVLDRVVREHLKSIYFISQMMADPVRSVPLYHLTEVNL